MKDEVKPNYAKRDRYKLAHDRLSLALGYRFYIEAAMICESIITDRIHSHLHWRVTVAQILTPESVKERLPKLRGNLSFTGHPNLGFLISVLHLDFDHFENDRHLDLLSRLDDWRVCRNRIAHGMVYTAPDSKSYADEFAAFLKRAEECARAGKPLINDLGIWDRAVRARHGKVPKASR